MPLLVIGHIIGTVLGAGAATFAEILHMRAMRDGVIDPEESATLKVTYRILRIGLFITIITGFGFLLYFRFVSGHTEILYSEKLWAKMTIVLLIPLNAFLLQMRKIPFWLGSAISLTAWYAAIILGVYRGIPFSYLEILGIFAGAVLIMAAALVLIRKSYYKIASAKP